MKKRFLFLWCLILLPASLFAPGLILSLPTFVWAVEKKGDYYFWAAYLLAFPLLFVFLAPMVIGSGVQGLEWFSVLFPVAAWPVLAHGSSAEQERLQEREFTRLRKRVAMLEGVRRDDNQETTLCTKCRRSKSNKAYTGKENELTCSVFQTTVKPGVVSCIHFAPKQEAKDST